MKSESAPGPLWHGGAPGRRVGDWLLPPSKTGLTSTVRQMSIEAGMKEIAQRDDLVYITTDKQLARAWAGIWTPDGEHHGGGTLYRVEADDLELDDDLLALQGVSFQAPRARVAAIIDPHVAFHPKWGRVLNRVLADHASAKAASTKSSPES